MSACCHLTVSPMTVLVFTCLYVTSVRYFYYSHFYIQNSLDKHFKWSPQGSVLGPLLFLCFINDLPDCTENNSAKIFADDLKFYRKNSGSSKPIQDDINRIENWSSQWQLPLNAQVL